MSDAHRNEEAKALITGLLLHLACRGAAEDLARLRAAYGQSAGTFLTNAGLIQVAAPADLDTAQRLSKALGNSTVAFETGSTFHSTPDNLEGHGTSS